MAERQKLLPVIKAATKAVENWVGPAKRAVKTVADSLQFELKSRVDPLENAEKSAKSAILTFEAAVRRANEEARRRAEEEQRRAEEAHRKAVAEAEEANRRAAAEAEAAAQKLAEEAAAKVESGEMMPWEVETTPVVAPPVVVLPPPPPPPVSAPVPQIALPMTAGVGGRNLPWAAEVYDLPAFLAWVLENLADRSDFIEIRMPALNAKAKIMGKDMEKLIPGVRAVQGRTIATR
jgi:hypothetical protein